MEKTFMVCLQFILFPWALDGVSESQFNQVLNVELNQIIKACNLLNENWYPKFVVIIAQKNHYTKFFLPASRDNVTNVAPASNLLLICHSKQGSLYKVILLQKQDQSLRRWIILNSTLCHYTLYKPSDLLECVGALHSLCCDSLSCRFPVIRENTASIKGG